MKGVSGQKRRAFDDPPLLSHASSPFSLVSTNMDKSVLHSHHKLSISQARSVCSIPPETPTILSEPKLRQTRHVF